jgi:putative SOS response-associated peptidase YedK
MCYHNSITKKAQEIAHRFKVEIKDNLQYEPLYHINGFNHPLWPIISNDKPDRLQMFRWGLIPEWIKSAEEAAKIQTMTLNAKSESVFEKSAFRSAIKTKHCLIPSTGFFEWKTLGRRKFPFYIYPKRDEYFSFAGIWEEWADRDTGEIVKSFSILTTTANDLMAEIHNEQKRMPVIIPPELEQEWLRNDFKKEDLLKYTPPFPDTLMAAHPISNLITSRSASSNVPEVIQKFEYPELLSSQLLF